MIYKIGHILNKDTWYIEKINNLCLSKINVIYSEEDRETVWVMQPTPLAAFSQALMLFNGETK